MAKPKGGAAPDWAFISGREYKLILAADRFADRAGGTHAFGDILAHFVRSHGGRIVAGPAPEERRRTWYLDTPALELGQKDLSLRLRTEKSSGTCKVTLKRRAADRYLVAALRLGGNGQSAKFEEDIVPPFASRFSHSVSAEGKRVPRLATVGDAAALFRGLDKAGIALDRKLAPVNDFEAQEVFRKLCQFRFKGGPKLKAGLSFWYLPVKRAAWPLIAEFSYTLAADGPEHFDHDAVRGAGAVFQSLQNQPGWITPGATTKTGFLYTGLA